MEIRKERVCILVKAYPQASSKYQEASFRRCPLSSKTVHIILCLDPYPWIGWPGP
jgi:hypothetical protein